MQVAATVDLLSNPNVRVALVGLVNGRELDGAARSAGVVSAFSEAADMFAIEVVTGENVKGKGSSREHSPVAERAAGVRLVIAESFERIYRQNADNLGLWTSTDFGLIERIRQGEPIDLEELLAGRDAVAAAILRAGGLLPYGQATARCAPKR